MFEAAARLQGFTRAADELGVTQAAVSRQIRALEDDLNTTLFIRAHRRIQLTPAGRVLAEAVGQSFDRIAGAVEDLRRANRPETLTISTSLAFSHFWLLPRLPSFRTSHPGLQLRVITQDGSLDLRDGGPDVLLRFGRPPFSDGRVVASHVETAFPVCSPDLAAELALDQITPSTISDLPLIDVEPDHAVWLTWRQWCEFAGMRRPRRPATLSFNHYSDAVYAAINGEGVVLGWKLLLDRPLSDGRLVRLGDTEVAPGDSYNVVLPGYVTETPTLTNFLGWLEACFASSA